MCIMNDRALRAIEQSKFTFDGEPGLTVITFGANAQGAQHQPDGRYHRVGG